MRRFWIVNLIVLLALAWPTGWARAQETTPNYPVYVVQEGDNLWSIALRFGVSPEDLAQANNIVNPDQLKVGDRLVIPGLEGITGALETRPILYGDLLRALSRRYQVSEDLLARLNHVSSPAELYAGATLILPQVEQSLQMGRRVWMAPGQSLLEAAVGAGVNPWSAMLANQFAGSWEVMPGEMLQLPGEAGDSSSALPGEISQITIGLPAVQGGTTLLRIAGSPGLQLGGGFLGHELHFFNVSPEEYVALQGVHALTEPGVYPLDLTVARPDGAVFTYSQNVLVVDANYPYEPVLYVDPATIDPQVTRPEDAQWIALAQPVTAEKLWNGQFGIPVAPEFKDCWPSRYGNRRSFNDSPFDYFHTGLDFCGQVGQDIFTPADGIVVFAGALTVRGNATMIDHGWGVYTAYMHQSEILVQVGDRVQAGQRIGLVGSTGRVTGPHLHWEVWVGGVQVDPINWLEQVYP